MIGPFEALAMASLLTTPPATGYRPVECAPWFAAFRTEIEERQRERGALRDLGLRLGAALVWDLADLPEHRARRAPWGPPRAGGLFMAGTAFLGGSGDGNYGGALARLIHRWDSLYPAFPLAAIDDHQTP